MSQSLIIRTVNCFAALLLITSSLVAQIPSYVPTNGLIGYWPFNGNANDESGNGNHGTVNGATLTVDRNGNANSAYSFDGVDDFIQTTLSYTELLNSEGLSISGWLKLGVIESFFGYSILTNHFPGSSQFAFALGGTNDGNYHRKLVLFFNSYSGGSQPVYCPINSINIEQWTYVTCTLNNDNLAFYINGELVFSQQVLFDSLSTEGVAPDVKIGQGNPTVGFQQNWNGNLDDIAIYNRALTPTEITALYTGVTTIPGCTNSTACNYNASATQDDGSCTFPAQTYLTCAGTCINDTDGDGICNELEVPTTPAYVPTNGLVGYWPFNGNANDESGNGNHGTVNGATLTTDRNGNANSAYSFNGISNEIIITDHPTLNFINSDLSICSWINTFSSESNHIFHKGLGSGNDNPKYIFTINNNNYAYHVNGPNLNTGVWAYSNAIPQMLVWENVCIVKSNDLISFFINGSLNSQTNFATPNPSTFGINAKIGGGEPNGQGWFNGLLDDIAIYNRALTPEEITALYNGTTTGVGGGGNGGTAGTTAPSVPQGIPYQAMIRDNNGTALINTPVTVRFSLRQDAIEGTVEYQETQALTTNAFGLINTQFGTGTATQGTFAGINWSNTSKFIQVEANTGAGYVDMGTQQMMSVPFALKANESNKVKNAGLPVYADNAAALAGGLVAGEMYRTATGDLKIVY
jgi:Concanavalin A-like lectin/glucanases superfamily